MQPTERQAKMEVNMPIGLPYAPPVPPVEGMLSQPVGGMHGHPWCPALLAMTHLLRDVQVDLCSPDQARGVTENMSGGTVEALEVEGITPVDVERMVCALEQCCDVSYR